MGRFENRPIAVGSYSRNNKKVEERRNGVWQTLGDFPFVNSYINGYSMVSYNEELYLFGMFSFNLKFAF